MNRICQVSAAGFALPSHMFAATLELRCNMGRGCANATQVRPDYVFISGWNEGIAQPQTIGPGVPPGASMGLESDPSARPVNSATGTGFVDTYGLAFGRDVEPSVVRIAAAVFCHGRCRRSTVQCHAWWCYEGIIRTDAGG